MAKRKETLHIMHMSSQFTDHLSAMTEDLREALKREPDIIGFTEMRAGERLSRMMQVCRNQGYRPVTGPGDCQMAIRVRPGLKLKGKSSIPIHRGTDRYGDKHLSWLHANFYGQDIYLSTSHWATRAQEGGIYAQHFQKMARAVVERMDIHARKGLAFWSGDINADPDEGKYPANLFRQHGVRTCWDDAGVTPGTRNSRTIDIIARHKSDARVDFKRYKIWRGYKSDHRPFSVWYDITVDRKNNNGGNNPGPKGGKGKDKDTKPDEDFLTGGKVSWKDYRDSTIYDLPSAVDDSDLFNG